MTDIEKKLENFPLEQYNKEMTELRNLIGKAITEPVYVEMKKAYDATDVYEKSKEKIKNTIEQNDDKKTVNGPFNNNTIKDLLKALKDIKNNTCLLEEKIEFLIEEKDNKTIIKGPFKREETLDYLSLFDDIKEEKSNRFLYGASYQLRRLKMFGVYPIEGKTYSINVENKALNKSPLPIKLDGISSGDMKDFLPTVTVSRGELKERKIKIPTKTELAELNNEPSELLESILDKNNMSIESQKRLKTIFIEKIDYEKEIINHIVSEYIKGVKKLANSNNKTSLRKERIIKKSEYDTLTLYKHIKTNIMICDSAIASIITERPNFILASKKNITLITEAIGHTWKLVGKTGILDINDRITKDIKDSYENLIYNDEMGDTVIIGRCPKEGEPGINLIVNQISLDNFDYSEDDEICAVNAMYEFYAGGKYPQMNYLSFELID